MKLTDFKTKSAWTIGILAIISLWIAFPLIFKYWVLKLLVTPPFTTEAFASLGPIGDIYGSLTALFTSATLIVVLYSAYLQREANKDTRQAMADQLQQARDATVKQLRQARKAVDDQLTQARESTAQQLANAKELSDIQLAYTRRTKEEQLEHARKLSDLQLAQAKESTRDQLALVQPTHDAQMLESKYAIFSNMFHALLSQKHERYSRIEVKNSKVHLNATEIFLIINETLSDLFDNEWKSISTLDVNDIQEKYFETTSKITGESEGEIGDNLSNLFLHLLGSVDISSIEFTR